MSRAKTDQEIYIQTLITDEPVPPLTEENVVTYFNDLHGALQSYRKPYEERTADPQTLNLRVSSLGKPAVLQALNLPHIQKILQSYGHHQPMCGMERGQLAELLHRGHQWEAWVAMKLRAHGYTVETQVETVYRGVTGHLDLFCSKGDDEFLLECKTMSPNYYRMFTRTPDDTRGYITQLCLYDMHVGLGVPSYWLCLDKGTHEVSCLSLYRHTTKEQRCHAYERVDYVIDLLQSVRNLEDVFVNIRIPPAEEEVYKKQPTGRYVLPSSMRYNEWAPYLYKLEYGVNGYNKPQQYVVGEYTLDELCSTEHWQKR